MAAGDVILAAWYDAPAPTPVGEVNRGSLRDPVAAKEPVAAGSVVMKEPVAAGSVVMKEPVTVGNLVSIVCDDSPDNAEDDVTCGGSCEPIVVWGRLVYSMVLCSAAL